MSRELINLGDSKTLKFQVKVSDCWMIEGRPLWFLFEPLANPEFPEWTGWRVVILWFAIWFVYKAKP